MKHVANSMYRVSDVAHMTHDTCNATTEPTNGGVTC